MRIGIDARALAAAKKSGLGIYLETILKNLPKEAFEAKTGNEIFLYSHKRFDPADLPKGLKVRWGRYNIFGSLWVIFELPGMLKRDKIDIFWGPLHILPLARLPDVKKVITIHDMVFRKCPETMELKNYWINRFLAEISIKNADLIISDSKNTEKDIDEYYHELGKEVKTIYPGLNSNIAKVEPELAKSYLSSKFNINKPFILSVGTHEPRKNFMTIYKAFSKVSSTIPHSLVSVGYEGWKTNKLLKEIAGSRLAERFIFLGYVNDKDLSNIYSAADLFLFPSLYEGFGLPPLEAMACGCPVIVSNRASLPEVVQDAGILIEPQNINLWADSMIKVLSDPSMRNDMRNKGILQAQKFNPKDSAAKIWEALKEQ